MLLCKVRNSVCKQSHGNLGPLFWVPTQVCPSTHNFDTRSHAVAHTQNIFFFFKKGTWSSRLMLNESPSCHLPGYDPEIQSPEQIGHCHINLHLDKLMECPRESHLPAARKNFLQNPLKCRYFSSVTSRTHDVTQREEKDRNPGGHFLKKA